MKPELGVKSQTSFLSLLHRRTTSFYLLVVFLGFVILFAALKGMLFFGVLLLLNIGLSLLIRPFKPYSLGIELNLLSAALAGLTHGPMVGAIFGAISAVVHFIAIGRISLFIPIALLGYGTMGFVAPSLVGMNFASLGVVLAIAYNAFIAIPIILFFRGSWSKCLMLAMVNIPFNFFLFSTFGQLLLQAMK